ncbi:hypothetical protein ACF3N0_00210 [Moraxella atlantae]|uniref:hypothetical protein n=1 Tax=Faucicola atlantae TaxID=34059 RepID=UPI0037534C14
MNIIAKTKITPKQYYYLCKHFKVSLGFRERYYFDNVTWSYVIWNPFEKCIWIGNDMLEDHLSYEEYRNIQYIFYSNFKDFIKAINEERLADLL